MPGAKVVLRAPGRFDERTTTTAEDGSYAFEDLPANQFRVTVTATGFESLTTGQVTVHAGEIATVPRIALTVAANATSVNVVATPEQVATEQVHEQEKQRVFGIVPNFYTSYIYNAAPMPTKLKYTLAFHALVDPVTLVVNGAIAGVEQERGTYAGYGPGIGGYGKRYAAQYGDLLFARLFGSALLPSIFHQDPRYFYQGSGGGKSRVLYAITRPFLTRGDEGQSEVNYSRLLGSLLGAALSNAYKPAANRGIGLTFTTAGVSIGATAFDNLLREFVLRRLEPTVPVFANGKKP